MQFHFIANKSARSATTNRFIFQNRYEENILGETPSSLKVLCDVFANIGAKGSKTARTRRQKTSHSMRFYLQLVKIFNF